MKRPTNTVADVSDDELLRRAVKGARSVKARRVKYPRWMAIMEVFGLGSTYAQQLCVRFDLDPDEELAR